MDIVFDLWMLFKVAFVFVLFFILLPMRAIRFENDNNTLLDKVFISLIHSVLLTIVIVHILVFLRLYDIFSLLLAYFAVYVLYIRYRGKSWLAVLDAFGMGLVVSILDASEKESGFLRGFYYRAKVMLGKLNDRLKAGIKGFFLAPFFGLFPFAAATAAAYLRLKPAIFHAAYFYSDVYLHLIWTKYLGLNQIYYDGVYPYGYHAVLSTFTKLSFIDPYWILRYMGGIAGSLLVLSVYYFSFKMTKNRRAALLGLVVYGLIATELPSLVLRHTSALPQEFAAIFVLPGLYFFWMYISGREKVHLFLFIEALACCLFIHSYAAVYLLLWAAVMLLGAILYRKIKVEVMVNLFKYGLLAGLFSSLPLCLGYLLVGKFHQSSADFAREGMGGFGFIADLGEVLNAVFALENPFMRVVIPLFVIGSLYLLVGRKRIQDNSSKIAFFAILFSTNMMLILYVAASLGLSIISGADRTGAFFTMMLATYYVLCFHLLETIFKRAISFIEKGFKGLLTGGIILTLCLMSIYYYPPRELYFGAEEYDACAENYLKIKDDFPALDWTIVGPQEQLSQALGMGYHSDLIRFVQEYDNQEDEIIDFREDYSTQHIFVFTEKRPFYSEKEVSLSVSELELEPEGDDPYSQYYKTPEQRFILEAKAVKIMEEYRKSFPDTEIYYEDDSLRIYYIFNEEARSAEQEREAI